MRDMMLHKFWGDRPIIRMEMLARSLAVGTLMSFGSAATAIAEPLADISLGNTPLRNQEITAGTVSVRILEFEPINFATDETPYLAYEVYVDGEFQTEVRQEVDFMFADFRLQNLDPDGIPEVIFHRYTGGAHCCSIYTIYSVQGNDLYRTITYPLDAAAAGGFEDLDGDGYSEFLSADQRFLYAFGSYASSWPPVVTLTFRHGSLIDTTRQFSEDMRSNAYGMYEQTRESTLDEPKLGANSILAGYVAQKILMDEYASGWDYMLAHYDPTDNWGLTEYNSSGESIDTFVDFPAALESFLIDLDYLVFNGSPNPNLDLSRVVVEQESLL